MKYPSKNYCKVCASNDSFDIVEYNHNNKSYRANCCGRYLSFVKYDDDDHKKMKEEVAGVLREKIRRGLPLQINKDKLLAKYPDMYPFILLNEVYMLAQTINKNFEFEFED